MNKIKLPSMVEYVKLQKENLKDYSLLSLSRKFELCDNFANFLSQQPNIGMFVPAVFEDGDWRILEAPNRSTHTNEECDQYQTALDNVIFEGFEYDGSEEGFIYVKNGETLLVFDAENKELVLDNSENNYTTEINTIEDLIPYSLTLTPKFAKEFGLI
jgi:hypothetical protein